VIYARNRTWAAQAPAKRPARPTVDQAEQRQRRHQRKRNVLGGEFSALREIADVAEPLADRLAATDTPLALRRLVLEMADAAHEFVGVVTGWLAEVDAHARTEHLADEPGKRRYAVTTLVDMAERPALPEVTDAMVVDGSWPAGLTAMAEAVDKPLAQLLARAYPPNSGALRGQRSRSERLESLLAETVDRAALALERGLTRLENRERAAVPTTDPRAELAALGITT